jgi:hypothetical protein
MMDNDEVMQQEQLFRQLEAAKLEALQNKTDLGKMSYFSTESKKNLVNEQLDPNELLDKLYHQISSDILVKDKSGNIVWQAPTNEDLIVFTEYGINRIMNILGFYINTNTLLSNYKEEQILVKMKNFANELNDLFLFECESIFYYVPATEYYRRYTEAINKMKEDNIDVPIFFDEVTLWEYCERKSQLSRDKRLNNYYIELRNIVDFVHSAYNRALNGEERETLRKNFIVSQGNQMTMPQPQGQKFSVFKPTTWSGK